LVGVPSQNLVHVKIGKEQQDLSKTVFIPNGNSPFTIEMYIPATNAGKRNKQTNISININKQT